MSNRIVTSGCAPYGAYELKATYQRNMLLAIVIVATTVGLVLLSAAVWSALAPAVPIVPFVINDDGGGGGGRIKLEEFVILPSNGGGPRHSPMDMDGVIPPPVIIDDTLEDETSITSYDEPAVYGEGEVDQTGSEEGTPFGEGGSDGG